MFRRISHTIALQFTAFVFLLLLANGILFLAADVGNSQREMNGRLFRTAHAILESAQFGSLDFPHFLPPPLRERVRIADVNGEILYGGGLFENVPFNRDAGVAAAVVQNERYAVLTVPIEQGDDVTGYLQVAELERLPVGGLPVRALIYLLVSIGISALTFVVGQFFARKSLVPAERAMQRLEQFTQDASHELRTPLATLSSSLDLALKTKQYREGIESAKNDLKEVSVLVERLLELARLDQLVLALEPTDLTDLVTTTVDRHAAAALEKRVTLTKDLTPDVMLHADAALLRQLLSNLLANAVKFSKSDGGTVTVRLTNERLSVTDTGIGIPAAELKRIFDRFYQIETSRSNDGFGLGLALVKRIADLHKWSVGVQSTEGSGTTFTVYFSSKATAKHRP